MKPGSFSGQLRYLLSEPDGGRKWLMAYAPIGAKGIYIYIYVILMITLQNIH